jgi:hypothetical protein
MIVRNVTDCGPEARAGSRRLIVIRVQDEQASAVAVMGCRPLIQSEVTNDLRLVQIRIERKV